MVEKIYIVWAKINRSTAKFDLGIYTDETSANSTKDAAIKHQGWCVWVKEYKLSKLPQRGK